ncbi:MAG: hypothetical protein EOP56_15825 [Sphingobacteriales bacterium]|nr:MAG: hypothetical protein EOP56_15825 [Sphingobacteriales bacterium]
MDKKNAPNEETAEKWHKDPENWKLWMFYFNPKDKRLLPPKRVKGMGWTVNFGNPYSILALAGLLAVIFALEYFL